MSNRGDLLRVRARFEETQAKQETRLDRFLALMGNGEGDLAVPGKPLFVYVRVLGRGVVECLNQVAALRNDLPIIVGYDFKKPDTLQVLSIYEGGMSSFGPYAYLPAHHQAHEFQNDEGGDDVVWVQKQQILPLLVYPTAPATMFVEVYGGWYQWDTDWHYFEETTSADLTARVPVGLPNEARFVLVSIDGATETLQYTNGGVFPAFWPPADREDMIPAPPEGEIPVAAIYLPFGTTAIPWGNIYDVRLIFSGGGAMSVGAAPRDASYVVVAGDPGLTAERTLTAGADVVITDGGAEGAVTIGRSGNKILKFDSDGAILAEYAATYAGLVAALAATAAGDIIWLPQCEIGLEAAITIPANVTLTGLTQPGTTEVLRPWGGAPGSEQYPKLYSPAYDPSMVLLMDGAVLEGVQVYRHAGDVDGAGVECAVSVGDNCAIRRCNIRCINNGTKRVAGIYLWGSLALAKDCVAKAEAGRLGVGGNDGDGIHMLGNLARAVDCTGLATSAVGTAAGIYVVGDCEVLRCIGDGHIGLLVASGTSVSRFSYYSGTTTALQVDIGATLSIYSDQYASQTINGTLTCLAGDRAGICRDETVTGDWNLNAGELGLPSGNAFPGAPQDGDVFYRTDLDNLYIYDGAAWDLIAGGGALPAVAGAGYALVSDGVDSWAADQTPLWTGEHSFEDGIAFVGATGVNSITVPDGLVSALHIIDDGFYPIEYLCIDTDNYYFLIDPDGVGINVGIGTTGPTSDLHIDAAGGAEMRLTRTTGATTGTLGQINFGNINIDNQLALIRSQQDGATDSGNLQFFTEATGAAIAERMRITSGGNVGIGVATMAPTARVHIASGAEAASLILDRYRASAYGVYIIGRHSRNATIGAHTIVQNNDEVFNLLAGGSNGTDFINLGLISFQVDGVPGVGNDMPGRIVFYTTPDGSGTLAKRMTIDSAGNVGIGTAAPATVLDILDAATYSVRIANLATDATNKAGKLVGRHFTNAEEDVMIAYLSTIAAANNLNIGGGSGAQNAATEIKLYTAANNTTVTGTVRVTVNSAGNVNIANLAGVGVRNVVADAAGNLSAP